jgi:hypothetical protein
MKPRRLVPPAIAALWALLIASALPGCGSREPTIIYQVPEGATARETQPGEPLKPPPPRTDGLPGPPPVNPEELRRPR